MKKIFILVVMPILFAYQSSCAFTWRFTNALDNGQDLEISFFDKNKEIKIPKKIGFGKSQVFKFESNKCPAKVTANGQDIKLRFLEDDPKTKRRVVREKDFPCRKSGNYLIGNLYEGSSQLVAYEDIGIPSGVLSKSIREITKSIQEEQKK